jgi:flagella basal body P-ring formation protein FlgA
MRQLFLAAALALAALAGPAPAGAQTEGPILLKTQVVVAGPVVRLGDIFDGLGEKGATPLARAPEPGKRAEVGARWLAAVAQAYALAWRPSSPLERVVIERAAVVIDTVRIEEAVRDALRRRGATGDLSLVFDNADQRLYLPSDAQASLTITGLSHDPQSGRFVANVAAPAEGPALKRAVVTGRVVQMTEIPVLRRRVEPHEIIRRQDVEWQRVRADRVGRNALTEIDALLGKSPRRPVRAGEPLFGGDLRAPIMVAKNSLVTIRLETARMVLTVQGRALDAGAEGDVIRVINTNSSKIINAMVADSGTVQVQPTVTGGTRQEVNLR